MEYVPDKTNYTEYLRIFLFYIILVLIIIGLLAGGYLLFKHAEDIKNKLESIIPKRAEPVPVPVVEEDPDDFLPELPLTKLSIAFENLSIIVVIVNDEKCTIPRNNSKHFFVFSYFF